MYENNHVHTIFSMNDIAVCATNFVHGIGPGGIGCPLWTFTTQHLVDTYQFVYSEPYACHINIKTHVKLS